MSEEQAKDTPRSMAQTLLRGYRGAAHAYHYWQKLHNWEDPRSVKAAANFEERMENAMRADPAMDAVDTQEMKVYPRVVCLCGSTRFSAAFRSAALSETLAGRIVLTIGDMMQPDDDMGLTDEDKERLDELHLRKIDLADEVYILNVGGYIGQ